MNEARTNRGFSIVTFTDEYGSKCSLQKSSVVEPECVWLGVDDPDPKIFVPYGDPAWRPYLLPKNVSCKTRMHLTREQVADLLPALTRFVETGDVKAVKESES